MSYCINPVCSQPNNPPQTNICQTCGSQILLRDRYRVLKLLSKGKFGATFLAQDHSLPSHPLCVLKQLRPATTESRIVEMAQELFEREVKTLDQIGNHPQVPRLLDYCEDAQPPYFVEQYIRGLTLAQEIKQSGPMCEEQVKGFLSEILPLLEFIHNQQIIHRDIKPANIIRNHSDGKLVLIDFGAVTVNHCQDPGKPLEESTWTDKSIGTEGFMPPEQINMRPVFASDIYALGATCICLLTGRRPNNLKYSPVTCELVLPEDIQLSEYFTKVLNKMLESSVRYRYKSAQEVLQALEFDASSSSLPPTTNEKLAKLDASDILTAYKRDKRNFSYQDLRELNLSQANLSGGIFHHTQLAKTNFQGADLSNAVFCEASLTESNLREANLVKAHLSYADLSGADLRGANLSDANLYNANLKKANLCGANLSNTQITKEQLTQAKINWKTVLPTGKQVFW